MMFSPVGLCSTQRCMIRFPVEMGGSQPCSQPRFSYDLCACRLYISLYLYGSKDIPQKSSERRTLGVKVPGHTPYALLEW